MDEGEVIHMITSGKKHTSIEDLQNKKKNSASKLYVNCIGLSFWSSFILLTLDSYAGWGELGGQKHI